MEYGFLSWDKLATFSGAVGATCVIVQLLKLPLDKIWKIPMRFVVYVVCLGIMLGATWFTSHALTPDVVAMCVVNAVIGTLAAMSLYEQAIALPEKQRLAKTMQYITTGIFDADAVKAEEAATKASVEAHVADAAEAAQADATAAVRADERKV